MCAGKPDMFSMRYLRESTDAVGGIVKLCQYCLCGKCSKRESRRGAELAGFGQTLSGVWEWEVWAELGLFVYL